MTYGIKQLGLVDNLRLYNGTTLNIYVFNAPLRRECV